MLRSNQYIVKRINLGRCRALLLNGLLHLCVDAMNAATCAPQLGSLISVGHAHICTFNKPRPVNS